ncbi:MAG: SMP-30/gluconolactonase/LRE family protein [Bacteroidales bacterium]
MKKSFITIYTLLLLGCGYLQAQSKDLLPEKSFTSGIEGPATDKEGNIYVVNFEKEGTIGKVSPDGKAELFVELPQTSIGNSIRINRDGHLIVADYTNHNLLEINPATKQIKVYAHSDKMNQPNDLALSALSGIIYASDPNWKEKKGQLWAIYPDGGCKLIEPDMGTTNGIELSPDNKTLYINESAQLNLWKYDVDSKGKLSNKKLIHKFDGYGLDGMKCDKNGNIYVTRYDKGTIEVLNPQGKKIKEYTLKGKQPSNLTFNPDETKLYITLQDRGTIEVINLEQ